jgi:hypothetical protein
METKATMTIIVKGDKFAAAQAAAARGIPFAFICETQHGETIGRVSLDYRADVLKWFLEPPGNAPFPVGTLLHCSEG